MIKEKNNTRNIKKVIVYMSVFFILLIVFLVITPKDNVGGVKKVDNGGETNIGIIDTLPWDEDGAKPIEEYTWEEFEMLEQIHQEIFIDSFIGEMTFEQWLERENPDKKYIEAPWENDNKKPEEYTWKEYESLSEEQQMMFIDYLDSHEGFEKWFDENQSK